MAVYCNEMLHVDAGVNVNADVVIKTLMSMFECGY